jgi:PAS domain S-box-containing protein
MCAGVAGDDAPGRRRAAGLALALALAGTGLTLGLWLLWPAPRGATLLPALNVFVVVSLAVGIRWHRPERRWPWLLLLAAQACSGAAFVAAHRTAPSAGTLLLIAHLGDVIALLGLTRNRSLTHRRASLTDVLIATTALGTLAWVLVFRARTDHAELGWDQAAGAMAALIVALLLALLAVRLVLGEGRPSPAGVLLLVWGALESIGGTSYALLVLAGQWTPGSSVFLLWVGASGYLVAAALHPSMRTLGQPSTAAEPGTSRARRLAVGATVLLLPAVLVLRVIQQDLGDLGLITAATCLISLLVVLRLNAARDRRAPRADRVAQWRLVAGGAAAVLLPLALMAESSIRLSERIVIEDAQDRVSTTSAVSAELVQKQMEGLAQLVGSYAERRLLADSLGNGTEETFDDRAVQRHLEQLRAAAPGVSSVLLTDARGRVGVQYPATSDLIGQDLSYRDWYHEALRTGRPYISEAYAASITGPDRVVAAASPVRRVSDARVLGVLVAVYDLRAIQAFAEDLAGAQGVRLRITDQHGTVVAAPGTGDDGTLIGAAGEPGVVQALRGVESLGTVEDDDGAEILAAYAPVRGLGWTVTAQVPTATAYASVSRLRATVLAVALLLGQVLLAGLLMMARVQRQRQAAERTLEEREQSTSAILEAAADAFVSIDENGSVLSWSHQAESLFGWTAQEALGTSLSRLIIPPALREQHEAGVHRFVTTGESTILGLRVEVTAVHRDGHEFPVELATWQSEVGGNRVFSAFVHDISDRKEYEAQLAAARDEALETSRVKTEFLSMMSHELRTPMNGVMGMTSLLLGTELTPEQRDYAETVRNSADSLLALLNDILDLSKVEADRLELEDLDFDLHQVVRDVVHLLRVGADQKGIALTAAIDDDVPLALRGDPGRLRQVLLNLVGNAIKFTALGSVHLRVLTDRAPQAEGTPTEGVALRFEIADTGIGIAPEALGHVFESFSQADASTTRRYGGTGLGLAISQRLVALFGGEIGVESELGAGSTFWFTARFLAGTPVVPSARSESTGRPGRPDARPSLILVVDDNATNQRIAVAMLQKLGHRADVAADGAEAVSAWASVPYDLILMDCRMPVMDGYEATRAIRAAEGAGRRMPIVAMTASAMVDDRERCLEAGMDDFLSKPVQPGDLHETVNHWLTGPAAGAGRAPVDADRPVTPGPPVLDPDIVAELTSIGKDFVVSLVEEFGAGLPAQIAAIRSAATEGDAERLARSAHALRGSAANLGGARVAEVCARLEEAGVHGRLDEAPALLPMLDQEAERLLAAMSAAIGAAV